MKKFRLRLLLHLNYLGWNIKKQKKIRDNKKETKFGKQDVLQGGKQC